MKTQKNDSVLTLNRTIQRVVKHFKPPEDLTVDEWADKYRHLSPESSAEPGPWRTKRTPYLKEVFRSFTDPKVRRIVMVAASQVGKSEMLLNMIGYVIDQDPGSILFAQPNLDDARKFSRLRVSPMIRDTKPLKKKVSEEKSRNSGNTILQKGFPGGILTIIGTNSASGLASTPARYIFADERDRWAISAGEEGDPWALAEARQSTFYNAKAVEVSTPTIKGASNIENSYYQGTQERWCHQCPDCEEYSEITFDRIRFDSSTFKIGAREFYKLDKDPIYVCPQCGCMNPEEKMKKQPAKWIAENPEALKNGCRSFWLNAFSSPWMGWSSIILKYLNALNDSQKLKVVYNTLLGQLWENRGDLEDEDSMMERREDYGIDDFGRPIEIPDGVFVLTCGVDTQGDRLEYEVVGHGHYSETWGIKKGVIMGDPADDSTWDRLDDVIDHSYRFKNQKKLKISITFVDSGGHNTQDVYWQCKKRQHKKVFAIKGAYGPDRPYTSIPSKVSIKKKNTKCYLYTIGVDSGKVAIMSALKKQEPGAKFCHFPTSPEKGYDATFFSGLLSERVELVTDKKGQKKWQWVKLPGHERNEALDCRNYAMAAFKALDPDTFSVEKRIKEFQTKKVSTINKLKPPPKRRGIDNYDGW